MNMMCLKYKVCLYHFVLSNQISNSGSSDGSCTCGHVFTKKKLIGGKRFSGKDARFLLVRIAILVCGAKFMRTGDKITRCSGLQG